MDDLLGQVLALWGDRLPLTPEQLKAFGQDAYARGWGLAGVWDTRFLEEFMDLLTSAMAEGTTLPALMPEVQQLLDRYGAGVKLYRGGDRADPAYVELALRNTVQGRFADGRYSAMWAPEWQQIAPFWRYYATLDKRTRPTHAALHGRVFRKSDAAAHVFLPPWAHNCFPAETPILGSIRRGFSYRYSGDVVVIQTRAGNRLTVTVDHPVLTPRGWVAAKELREGDHVISNVDGGERGLDPSRTDEAVRAILGPRKAGLAAPRLDVHGRPAFAGELFRALPEALRERRMGVRSEDLYGDPAFEQRHIEVERQNGELLLDAKSAAAKLVRDLRLTLVHVDHAFVTGLRYANALLEWYLAAAAGLPRLRELAADGSGIALQGSPLRTLSLGAPTQLHAELPEARAERRSGTPGFLGEPLHGLAGEVPTGEHLHLDRVHSIRFGTFDGAVFDFETSHGWMVASGIVISNCRCQAQELTLAEVEEAGFEIFSGEQVPLLPTSDGGIVGRPEGTWDVDRLATTSRVLLEAPQPRPG